MEESLIKFIQPNSPDGGFLQSDEWRKFQEAFGRKTFQVKDEDFQANIIEHRLPVAGKYFYIPRGPVMETDNGNYEVKSLLEQLLKLAAEENIGWIRFEPSDEKVLGQLGGEVSKLGVSIKKAPHDVQPREILIVDITKSEEQFLSEMKSKTRYNIRLAEKKGISLRVTDSSKSGADLEELLKLIKITAERQKIKSHPENYYRKMWETLPEGMLRLYSAEYEGKIIAANLVLFFGKSATYLHGASADEYREVMAPYLLQWRSILDARNAGCERYDFGGVKMIEGETNNDWAGITRFKTGFSPATAPTVYPGTFDLIINPFRYRIYLLLRKAKGLLHMV